ncbi:MAG: hypothetical protein PHW08_14760 [Kiritimatiellae bacterium]|nr:hypothetical protein [Kiritimatiellia bacterium]
MSVEWLISKNDEAPASLEALGVSACSVSLAANGDDSMSFTVDVDYTADPAFPARTKVALVRRDGEAERCVFVGWIRSIPRISSAEYESVSYTAEGPSALLRRVSYAQEWTTITADDGTPAAALEPRVILGEDNAGARRSTGEQIADILAYAAAQGLPIAAGAVDAGLTAPRDERENISCMEAILAMLRWTPTQVLSWDYDNRVEGVYTPAAHVAAAADMPAVDAALHGADVSTAEFTPRYDLQVPGIVVTYRIAGSIDGRPYERRAYDTAGDADDPERMSFYVDLEGSTYEVMRQDVVTGTYPTAETDDKQWLISLEPWLAALPLGDWMTLTYARTGVNFYPRYLIEGSLCEWMGVEAERETFTIKVRILTRDAAGKVTEDTTRDISLELVSTTATTRSYTKNFLTGGSEPIPLGLADAIYAEWAPLQWDGRFSIDEEEATFAIRPGVVLNWTGARTEWAGMRAVVQSATYDIASGATSVSTGPCGRLEADSRLALFRAVRSRRNPTLSPRDDGELESLSGPEVLPEKDTVPVPPDKRHRLTVRDPDSLGNAHEIDLDPAGVSFGQSANAAPQSIRPREVSLLQPDGSVRKAQILSGEPYGDPTAPGEPEPPPPPPCGHPGNAGGGGGDEDHPANEDGAGGDVDHPGSEEGEGGITPESGGTCE